MAPLPPFDNTDSIIGQIRMKLLLGVYNDTYQTMENGGQQCYQESELGFKIILCAILLPFHLYYLYQGMKNLVLVADARKLQLLLNKRSLNPTLTEMLQGLVYCIWISLSFAVQQIFKFTYDVWTLIDFWSVNIIQMNNTAFSWLGIVFGEIDELSELELLVYYIQHVFAALMAPLVIFWAGRYKADDYIIYPLPIFGFVLFTIYMRYFLTPISAMTWANLNHTLCGIDNDPWRVTFGMHKYFYLWADGYLQLASVTISFLNYYIAKCFCKTNKFETQINST
eukprot:403343426